MIRNGEEHPRAYCVKALGRDISEQDVAKWMETKVSKNKRLTGGVKFVDAISKNPVCNGIHILGSSYTLTAHSLARFSERHTGSRRPRRLEMRPKQMLGFDSLGFPGAACIRGNFVFLYYLYIFSP